jgi:flagellar hook-basal body complex protein FliE
MDAISLGKIQHLPLNPTVQPTEPGSIGGADFGDLLGKVSETLKAGEEAAMGTILGEIPMHQAVNKVLEAERTLTTVIAARDKFVNAYLELTRMQI